MNRFLLPIFLLFSVHLMAQEFDGFALYNSLNSSTTFLIDKDGNIAHRWNLPTRGNYAVLLKDNGNIVRGAIYNGTDIRGAAVGGMVQEWDKDANLIWEHIYSDATKVSHHDITLMPQGGVLLTAWEVIDRAHLDSLGYLATANQRYGTHFVELRQIAGTQEAEVVWEWHIVDHMVQDGDPDLSNYGVIADNPQLMDVNVPTSGGFGGPGGGGDWFHVNGVNYSETLDLITFSSRFLSEIFVIDHSTTSAEAAGHTGGNSGMGGDFLYRWGNPSNYDTPGNRRIMGPVHDARFIPDDGRFRGGFIQFFNNAGADGTTAITAIDPPFNGTTYDREPGKAYGPEIEDFSLATRARASGQSASNAMPNGNTFVNLSGGYMYEEDRDGNMVWQYPEGPAKAFRYTCDHPGIKALLGDDSGCPTSSTKSYLVEQNLQMAPNPSDGFFNITGLSGLNKIQSIEVMDSAGKILQVIENQSNTVDLSNNASGFYLVKFNFDGKRSQTKMVSVK